MDEITLYTVEGEVGLNVTVPLPEEVIDPFEAANAYKSFAEESLQYIARFFEQTTDYPLLMPMMFVLFNDQMVDLENLFAALHERVQKGENPIDLVREFLVRRNAAKKSDKFSDFIDAMNW